MAVAETAMMGRPKTKEAEASAKTPSDELQSVVVKPGVADITAAEPDAAAESKPPKDPGDAGESKESVQEDYYADLDLWLRVTGYHNREYRDSKLRVHKERLALEEEAARIRLRLEELHSEELLAMEVLRHEPPPSTSTLSAAPPLPADLPSHVITDSAHLKRSHSPSDPVSWRNVRQQRDEPDRNDCRPCNDSASRGGTYPRRARGARNPYSGSSRGNYHSSYGYQPYDSHVRSSSVRSRDPSLERRQAYYSHDVNGAGSRYAYQGD
ncbi:hypothetical protein K470DRAFT_270992 [Piedraia hortae CBS 480.64]|uniref:Uncharacterized protein n=1 Tax=Piedraia hortae CBS 480.64 TaxID=1314780 RepID=A0A6A7BZD6_9PEZI|nr:hypothetical protein K470DRAFT_270992 [Piedraia hortae CBS 480.64]